MGLTLNFIQLLERSKEKGIKFDNLATLGNQYIYSDYFELSKIWSKSEIEDILESEKGYANTFYKNKLQANTVTCFDFSDYEGAQVIHDFNTPIAKIHFNQFDVFLESGSLEHIFNFPVAIANCMNVVKLNGYFIGIFPTNNFCGHGFYQFSPELMFRIFSSENGFVIDEIILFEDYPFSPKISLKDPDEISKRMDFCNSKPAYIYVVAKKIANNDIFQKPPLQSDYVSAWVNDKYNPHKRKKIVFKYNFLNFAKDWFNKYIRRKSKYILGNLKRKYKSLGDLSNDFVKKII